ncbi:MAG TPA: alkaline phosphatase family protein [Dehalococcoidia bacterium]|nr:alkaline phosphatase family protein [Dehalococcoidia bacterium]
MPAHRLFATCLSVAVVAVLAACGGDDNRPSPTASVVTPTSRPSSNPGPRDQIPLDHIVVLMQENRSFDSYFGRLRAFDPTLDVEAQPADASNPDPTNAGSPPIKAFHQTALCATSDLNHSWPGTHQEWDNGTMDGFTRANADARDPTGSRAMGYYDQTDLPFYYSFFDTFAIGDRYFSSLLGPTQPNRFFLYSGTSAGRVENGLPPGGNEFSQKTIFDLLDEANVSWKIYTSQFAYAAFFAYVRANSAGRLVNISNYYTDAAAGQLPQVAFVDPIFAGGKNEETDEHPPANVQVGQRFVADVVDALFKSPNWPTSAMFLVYDEHGGFYDHVPPPIAVPPDDIAPASSPGDSFDRYGIRVPVAVVSPFAKKHFVSHVVNDHTSILRFIETRFGLPSLTRRDAAADPMLEFFDFASPAFGTPPELPEATIDPARKC